MSDDATTDLVQELRDNADRLGLTWQLRYARVVDGSDPAAVQIVFDGDDTTTAVPAVSLIGLLRVGERVAVTSLPPAGQYIVGRPGVPIGPLISRVESASSSAAVGVGGATVLTIPSATYPNGSVFRVRLGALWFGSVANQATIQIYVNSTGGTLLQQFRTPTLPATAGLAAYFNHVGYFRNQSGVDMVASIVVFALATVGTVTQAGGATFTRWAETEIADNPAFYALSTQM